MKAALAGALLILSSSACRGGGATEGTPAASSTPVASSSSATASATEPPPEGSVSKWSNVQTEAVELAVAPNRAALITFEGKTGYVLRRGNDARRLPREWFGAGPPRQNLSISDDGSRLAIPDSGAVVVYHTDSTRWLGRFTAPQAGAQGKVSADGKFVTWSAPGTPCSRTEIASGALQKTCP